MPAIDKKKKNSKTSGALPELSKEDKIGFLRDMLLIRRFEEKSAQAFTQAKIKGFCHLYIGPLALGALIRSIFGPFYITSL